MKGIVKSEFQLCATPDQEMSRHLAYLAAQDSGSVLTGGFVKDRSGLGEGQDRADKQTARALEFLTQQEQIRQQRVAELTGRLDALELAARDALFDAENELGDILSNANRDSLGRAVFMDDDGQLRSEDGSIVEPDTVDMTEWDPSASTWQEYQDAQTRARDAQELNDRVQGTRERFESDLSEDDLDALERDLAGLEAELAEMTAPSSMQSQQPASDTASTFDPQVQGAATTMTIKPF